MEKSKNRLTYAYRFWYYMCENTVNFLHGNKNKERKKEMNLNEFYNENERSRARFQKVKKLNWEDFQKSYEGENKLPEYVKGNSKWVKDLYKDIDSLPAVDTAAIEKKNKIKSEFINEAEKIYNFDKITREADHIKDFEKNLFDSKIKNAGFDIPSRERKKKNDLIVNDSNVFGNLEHISNQDSIKG